MHWFYLVLAILLEVTGTTSMKMTAGFTRFWPTVTMIACYIGCFYFLPLAIRKVDLSVAYAMWSGIGTALIATIGVLWFREPVTLAKVAGLLAIIIGVVTLNLSGRTP